ncbi:hypothetical protein DRH14_05180 [Candidatus Shapirobacteria bacterium]|nr:MAG: hypothetical protein DRH14_05180 [Candidatus Shapirobacteria bacterium]
MLIGIDANEANQPNRVGIGHYAYQLIKHIHQIDKKNKYIVYLKKKPLADMPQPTKNWQYKIFGPSPFWTRLALPLKLYLQKPKLDVFFSPSHYSPWPSPFPTIPSIMDLGFLKYNQQFTKKDLYQLTKWTAKSTKQAKKIVTISKFSQQQIHQQYQIPLSQIKIAYPGINPVIKSSAIETKKTMAKFSINQNYFLYLGSLKPSKNIVNLIKAFHLYLSSHKSQIKQLVIAGPKGWLFKDIFSLVNKLKLQKSIVFTGYISEKEKWLLLKKTKALIIPSFYEGFGIPAIEAQKVGTPVLASSITVLKEILVNSAIYFNPKDISQIKQSMSKISLKDNKQKYSSLGLKNCQKFNWTNTAKKVIETITN